MRNPLFKTRVTELLGIEYPIIQGGLGGGLAGPELISAVSNAGGLGMIAAINYATPKELREEVKKTRSLTDKPIAANFPLMPTIRPINYEDFFNAAIEEGVTIIETSAGKPEQYVKLFKDAGVKWIHKVGSARHAATAERMGADAVSVVCYEAAGHPMPDNVAGSVLIPVCVNTVKIPVIAAGGTADARGFVAALALGAEGVMMGTRFVASKECDSSPKLKEWFLKLSERDTMTICHSIPNLAMERVIRTAYTQKILEMEAKGATLEQIVPMLSGQNVRDAYRSGDMSKAVITAGQTLGLISDIRSVKEIIDGMISEAQVIVKRLYKIGGFA